ncbi:MAG: TM2 domain-containing protein [Pirellulaceae bacterium]|nr:TM2 domain-containing protein [Pirellulaceae bacterium]
MNSKGRGKEKVLAGILGILIGGLGVHHFYLGSTTSGVILLVASLFTCGFASIVGLIEGIMLLVMNDEEFDARYNQREPEGMEFVFTKPNL